MRGAFVVALLVTALFVVGAPVAQAIALPVVLTPQRQQPVPTAHEPPVDAPIIDPFRPPAGPFAPGNRGIEYDTTPGQTVRASADGVVTFAGQVGGNLFVTISHDSSLRTTVGFVDEVLVHAGEHVSQGEAIALAGDTIHFTARRNGEYFDPETLFIRYRVVVRLIAR